MLLVERPVQLPESGGAGSIHSQQERQEPPNDTRTTRKKAAQFVIFVRVVSCVFVVPALFIENEETMRGLL
jgi:hypothetical protein